MYNYKSSLTLTVFLFFVLSVAGIVPSQAEEANPELAKQPTNINVYEDGSRATIFDTHKLDVYKKQNLNFTTTWPADMPANQAFIPRGLIMNAKTDAVLDTSKVKKGDNLEFEITDNVYLNGVLVIKAGTKGTAVISTLKPPGAFLVDSILSADMKETHTVNNIAVPLMLELYREGYNEPPIVTAAVISVYTFFLKGKYIVIPANTHFFVAVRENVNLNTTLAELNHAL